MSAISSKALLKTTDPYKYNAGSELEEELGYYQTFFRKYDAQIGRFTGVDIRSEESAGMTVYNFGANNPILFNDPNGDQYGYMDQNGNKWHGADPLACTGGAGQSYQPGNGFNGFGDGGGGGGGGGGVGGTATAINGGYKFTGSSAIDVFNRFSNAYNSRNEYDEWSFSVGQDRQGNIGYWQPFDLPNYRAGNGLLEGVSKGTSFVNLGDIYRQNGNSYNYADGTIQHWTNTNNPNDHYADFTSLATGKTIRFPGAYITNTGVTDGAGVTTSNGSIRADLSFTLADLQHEYGHYLQAMMYGNWIYYSRIVPASLYSATVNSYNGHMNFWTEKDANAWSTLFFGNKSAIGQDASYPKEFSHLMNNFINK